MSNTRDSRPSGPEGALVREGLVDDDVKVYIRDVGVVFQLRGRSVQALRSIDLEIHRGEFLVIVGPSGCGKTTLLRILAGLEGASTGSVEVYCRPGAGDSDPRVRRPSAMVFQEHGIFAWKTVRDNVAFGLKAQGVGCAERRARAQQHAEKVGLAGFLDAYPHQLSGGMRQRVSIARALATDPDLLLMDEPFAALDEQTKLSLQDQLIDVWEESRKTVVYVTHSLDEALVLGDRVLVMSGRPGSVRDILDVSAVFDRPRHVASVRAHPRYGELFGRLWHNLKQDAATTTVGTTTGNAS